MIFRKQIKIFLSLFFSFGVLPFLFNTLSAKALVDGNKVTFTYKAPDGTQKVTLRGDFNGWGADTTPLKYDAKEKVWKTEMDLPDGEHIYKFFLNDSEWQTDPDAVNFSKDEYKNAVVLVGMPQNIVESHRGDGEIYSDVILHAQKTPYLDLLSDGRAAIRLRANKNDVENCVLVTNKGNYNMDLYGSDDYFDYYRVALKMEPGEKYSFLLTDGNNSFSYPAQGTPPFVYHAIGHPFLTPDWAKDAVFYQIYPNSFFNGNTANDPIGVSPWNYEPLYSQGGPKGYDAYYGGDLEGVIQKMDYLKNLGIRGIYLNPLFEARSTHKYNTGDYMKIDPTFGDDAIFKQMLETAHKDGIRVIIDGVFNHSGSAFFAFQDLLRNQVNSKYKDWYYVKDWQQQVIKDGKPLNYEAWAGFGELPKFNVLNPDTKKYLRGVIEKWGKMGLDGWRLDVADGPPHEFWRDFRKWVKDIDPQAYIVGEIWSNASAWLKGDQFDSVMNYRFRSACLEFFAGYDMNKDNPLNEAFKQTVDPTNEYWKAQVAGFRVEINADVFDNELGKIRVDYPDEATNVMLNLLDSHDRYRFLMLFLENIPAYKLAIFFQMTYPGTPCIYYGSEVGMEGGRDPDDRRAMPWDKSQWNMDIYDYVSRMIGMRNAHSALRRGDFRVVYARDKQYAFVREDAKEKVLVLLNNQKEPVKISIPWKGAMVNFMLKPYEGRIEVQEK